MVFSMKLTPNVNNDKAENTERLNVILIKSTFNVFDHETCLSDGGVSHHSYFDDNTTAGRG
jgi:hypothetical protein